MTKLTQELKLEFKSYNQDELNHAFMEACEYGDFEIVRYLLTSPELTTHADIHVEDDEGFILASNNGYLDIVKYLLTSPELKDHVDIHVDDNQGFELACQNGCWDVVAYFVTFSGDQYIDFQKTDHNLDWAMYICYHEIVKNMAISLYKNNMIEYVQNHSKIEEYCKENGLNFYEWQEEMMKEDN